LSVALQLIVCEGSSLKRHVMFQVTLHSAISRSIHGDHLIGKSREI